MSKDALELSKELDIDMEHLYSVWKEFSIQRTTEIEFLDIIENQLTEAEIKFLLYLGLDYISKEVVQFYGK